MRCRCGMAFDDDEDTLMRPDEEWPGMFPKITGKVAAMAVLLVTVSVSIAGLLFAALLFVLRAFGLI